MPEYEQINLKVKKEEMDAWKAQAEKIGVGMTQYIRNCVNRTITGDNNTAINMNRQAEERKLDVLVSSQQQVIELLNQLMLTRENQKEVKAHMIEIAKDVVEQGTFDRVLDAMKVINPASIKQIAKHSGLSEVKVMEALRIMESEGRIKRNFLRQPNTFEVA